MKDPCWDVIVAGDLFIDLVMTGFATLPGLGEEGFASACRRETGGGAANTSCGLARLGLKTAVFGVAGADEIGWFRRCLSARGVDEAMLVEHASEPTAITVAISTQLDRIFYTFYGANVAFPELIAGRETWRQFARARHVHFAYPVEPKLLAAMAQWLRAHGIGTSIDVGWQQPWLDNPDTLGALAHVDWFFPNEHEAQHMTGESEPARMLAWYHRHGARGVVLKLGPQGSAALIGDRFLSVPSVPVTPLDTTGAGDCFNAGFLYGVLTGLPLERRLRYGNICGALSTEAAGGIAGFPALERVQTLVECH